MNSLILIVALTMSTSLTFENSGRGPLTEDQVTWVKAHCFNTGLERMEVNYNENGIRSIRCWSLIDSEVDITSES